MNDNTAVTILDIDSILDMQMSDVVDIPDYITPDTGMYMLAIQDMEVVQSKEDGKPARIKAVICVSATIELADGGMPVADGSLFTLSWQGTQQGLEYFKRDAKKWLNVDDLSGLSMSDVFEGLKALEPVKAKVVQRKSVSKVKDPETGDSVSKTYTNIDVTPLHDQ